MEMTFFRVVFVVALACAGLMACDQQREANSSRYTINSEEDTVGHMTERFRYQIDTPICNEFGCTGKYTGVEFVDREYMLKLNLTGTDIAHNYSNLMCTYVGKHLKELYKQGKYSKVDLRRITLTTKGMGDGDDFVEYTVSIPIIRVRSKAEAMTAFDHSGGWGHTPALKERKKQLLKGGIVKDRRLYVSPLTKTPEGLQEYWIQWRHVDF